MGNSMTQPFVSRNTISYWLCKQRNTNYYYD